MNSSVTVLIRSTWQDSLVSLEPGKSLFDTQMKCLLEHSLFLWNSIEYFQPQAIDR